MKKNLNKKEFDKKDMEGIYREDYKALEYYAKNVRVEVNRDKNCPVNDIVEERLKKRLYITFDENSKDLYHSNYILTIKGSEYYLSLKENWQKDYLFWLSLGAFTIALVSLYFTGKTQGWWG